MSGIKSMGPLELLLLVMCWWHLSMIRGNPALASYSRTAMPSDHRDDGRSKDNVRQTGDKDNDTGISRKSFEAESLGENAVKAGNGAFETVGISSYI